MDIMMTVMNGLRAAKRIRQMEKYRKTPILAMTALKSDKNDDICLKAGMNDILNKPVKSNELLLKIEHWLNSERIN